MRGKKKYNKEIQMEMYIITQVYIMFSLINAIFILF